MNISGLIDDLEKAYGQRPLIPHGDPLKELILTILSQNTSDVNSRPAFERLRQAFPDWEQLVDLPLEIISVPIKSSGLALIKAGRIQAALKEIKRQTGKLDISFLKDTPVDTALSWLKNLKGVGDKTANCVLLFTWGKPALPVDTHIFRVSIRLGLIAQKTTLDEAHRELKKLVPEDRIYPFHVLVIEHGRRICVAKRPKCSSCVIRTECQSYLCPRN